MNRSVRLLSFLAACTVGASAHAAPSQFQKTCSDIKLSEDGTRITATCKKRDGTPVPATLQLTGVENQDGKLTRTGKETGYTKSCHTQKLSTNDQRAVLTAICKKANGAPSNTQLELMGINNIDGVLTQQ